MGVSKLEEIEEVKKLKARYFRLMDQRQWEKWADLFMEDAVVECVLVGDRTFLWRGRDQIVSSNREHNTNVRSIHHGHTPDIEITSETTATGSWALFDLYFLPSGRAEAYGYYDDHYVKKDGRWKIQSSKLILESTPK